MNKKTIKAAIALSITIILMVAGANFVINVKANPFMLYHHIDPIPGTIPPSITIFGPQNNTVLNSNSVYFGFNASKPQPPVLMEVGIIIITYSQDNSEPTDLYSIYNRNMTFRNGVPPGLQDFNYSTNLTLPQGNHQISIHTYNVALSNDLGMFGMDSYATVFFTINTSPLKITNLSLENKVYNTKDVLLSFSLNEPVWWQAYSLDNQANATIRGNTTLTGLRDGAHSVVVYANDFAGNTGLSILAHFVVAATPPNISNISIENKTYNTTSIPLNFTLSDPSTVGYCLDGKANVSIAGNITLTGLGEVHIV
jgi:hypothetical protein